MKMTTHRSITAIESDLKAAGIKRDNFRRVINEGQGGYVDESEINQLTTELQAAKAAASPLATREGIESARGWAKAQGWTANDLASANKACLARGYSLAELQAAIKSL